MSDAEDERARFSRRRRRVFETLRPILSLVSLVVSLAVGFVIVEVGLHWLAENHLGRGKLFEPDPEAGWRTLPNLDLARQNADGAAWRIVTDDFGLRETGALGTDESRRMLVLGDSLAFGEGTNIEDRFDSILESQHPDLSIVNTGTMGYGTFQQVVRGRPFFDQLRAGDTLLLLTCSNDFIDMLRPAFSGRSKPRFELSESGEAIEHFPGVSLADWARDRSYIAARIMSAFFEDASFDPADERRGLRLYEALVRRELFPLSSRGVRVILAYYDYSGHPDTNGYRIEASFERLCSRARIECLDVNRVIERDRTRSQHLLSDGHWNPTGHRALADLLSPLF